MKFTKAVLLLALVAQAACSKSKQTTEDSKTEKRALLEGNAGVQKRNPVLSTALPLTPGIEYADSKDPDVKPLPQQIYATPVPQLAKISDVLTGQGPPFQAAIASHLFSPVSIYQPRFSSPAYEVSAPVPSQLAYAEKITYQPQIPQQFTPQLFKPKTNLRFLQPVQQFQVPQPSPQLAAQQIVPQPQQIQIQPYQQPIFFNPYQAVPQQPFLQQQINQQQITQQQIPQQQKAQQQIVQQQLAHQQIAPQPQPGIVYAREQEEQKPIQRELNTAQTQAVQPLQNVQQKPVQNYNTQHQGQGAFSFASFSVGPAQTSVQYEQNRPQYLRENLPKNDRYQQQNHAENQAPQQFQPQIQQYQTLNAPLQPRILQYYSQHAPSQPQIQQYQSQNAPSQPQIQQYQAQNAPSLPQIQQYQAQNASPQLRQYQILREPLPPNPYQSYQTQPQSQIQIQPQVVQKLEPSPANSIAVPSKLTPGKDEYQVNTQYAGVQPQFYQAQNFAAPNPYANQGAVPTFPPVQFFGKYARTLFKQYQQ